MVRWRYCLVLAMLLLLPVRTATEDEEDEEPDDENDDNDNDADEDEDTSGRSEVRDQGAGRRAPAVAVTSTQAITRTMPKRPLECYICAYKAETQLRSCLDPTKHRVHTMTCHNLNEKCFTSVISKGNSYEAIMRGCRSECVSTPGVTCCELNRCNNQAFAMPLVSPRALASGQSKKAIPQTVLFFVTILLVLQTVVKVAVV